MSQKLIFELQNAEILEQENNSQFVSARIDAFSTGLTRNNTTCDVNALKKSAPTIFEKPILFTISSITGDFFTHVDEDKNLIAGFVVPNSAEFKENANKTITLSVIGKIWVKYAQKFLSVFRQEKTNTKKVSVEVDVINSDKDNNDVLVMKDWIFDGICVLSDLVTEASPGANIQLSFAEENKEYKEIYDLEFGSHQNDLDFTIPSSIKSNASKGLELKKKFGRGSGLAKVHAEHLTQSEKTNPDKIKHASHYMLKKGVNKFDEVNPTDNQITFMLWGGEESLLWTKNLFESLDNKDGISYFDELPTNSVKDFADNSKWGTGETITVDKSKDSMSSSPWGNVDKTALMHKVLNAKNYKSLVNDVYAIVDSGWEDHPSSSLHYPIMQITGSKAVYNRYGLSSALQRAEGQNETSVVSKIKGIYTKLELNKLEKNNKEVKRNMSNSANLDTKAVLAFLKSETKDYQELVAEYSTEGDDGEKDFAKLANALYCKGMALQEMCKGFEETMAANKAEAEKKKAEAEKEKVDQEEDKKEMAAKMAAVEEEKKQFSVKIEELEKFKADVERKEFNFAVDSTLKYIEETVEIPAKELEILRSSAKDFKTEDVEGFKNMAKAKAFGFPTKKDAAPDNGDKKIGFPWGKRTDTQVSIWDKIGK
jgi:hypothetical protein